MAFKITYQSLKRWIRKTTPFAKHHKVFMTSAPITMETLMLPSEVLANMSLTRESVVVVNLGRWPTKMLTVSGGIGFCYRLLVDIWRQVAGLRSQICLLHWFTTLLWLTITSYLFLVVTVNTYWVLDVFRLACVAKGFVSSFTFKSSVSIRVLLSRTNSHNLHWREPPKKSYNLGTNRDKRRIKYDLNSFRYNWNTTNKSASIESHYGMGNLGHWDLRCPEPELVIVC